MQCFEQFALADHALLAKQFERVVHVVSQHVAHCQEARLAVGYHAAVGRDAYLAVGAGIQGVYGLVAACPWREVYQYLCLVGREVFYVANLDLATFVRLQYALDEGAWLACRTRSLAVWYLGDGKRLAVSLLYPCPDPYAASSLSVVILADVDAASRGEVGVELELLAMQVLYRRIAYLPEVVRQYLAVEPYGDALCSLC